jgi:hypothetical protein
MDLTMSGIRPFDAGKTAKAWFSMLQAVLQWSRTESAPTPESR